MLLWYAVSWYEMPGDKGAQSPARGHSKEGNSGRNLSQGCEIQETSESSEFLTMAKERQQKRFEGMDIEASTASTSVGKYFVILCQINIQHWAMLCQMTPKKRVKQVYEDVSRDLYRKMKCIGCLRAKKLLLYIHNLLSISWYQLMLAAFQALKLQLQELLLVRGISFQSSRWEEGHWCEAQKCHQLIACECSEYLIHFYTISPLDVGNTSKHMPRVQTLAGELFSGPALRLTLDDFDNTEYDIRTPQQWIEMGHQADWYWRLIDMIWYQIHHWTWLN